MRSVQTAETEEVSLLLRPATGPYVKIVIFDNIRRSLKTSMGTLLRTLRDALAGIAF